MKKTMLIVMVFLFSVSVLLITDNALCYERLWFPGETGSYWTYDFGGSELTLTLGFETVNNEPYGVLKEQGLDLGEEDLFSLPFCLYDGKAVADIQNEKFLEWLKTFVRNNRNVLQQEDFMKNEEGIKEPITGVHAEIKNLYGAGQRKLFSMDTIHAEGVVQDSDGRNWYCWTVLEASATVEFSNGDSHTEDVVILGRYDFDSPETIQINGKTETAYLLSYFLDSKYAERKDPTPILKFPVWNLKIVPGIGVVSIEKVLNGQQVFSGSLKSYQITKGQSVDSNGKIATAWGNIKK